jgi:hypothetical protein
MWRLQNIAKHNADHHRCTSIIVVT